MKRFVKYEYRRVNRNSERQFRRARLVSAAERAGLTITIEDRKLAAKLVGLLRRDARRGR